MIVICNCSSFLLLFTKDFYKMTISLIDIYRYNLYTISCIAILNYTIN